MATSKSSIVKLVSTEGTGEFYTTTNSGTEKLLLKKYDKKLRRHVLFKQDKKLK